MRPLPSPTTDTPTLQELRHGLGRLEPGTAPGWGTLNAVRMVDHCARFVDLYLGRVSVSRPIRIAARLIGPLFLRRVVRSSPVETPRNLRTLGELKSDPANEPEFRGAVGRLLAGLGEVEALDGDVDHVMYGRMDAESVRTLVRHHTAHHFHQFGLLDR